jgi:aminoglycoside/choline kinase family phosphotransferase
LENGKILVQVKLKKISSDASFREFYRIKKNSTSSILVKANQDKYKNLIVYSAVNKLLIDNKIKAPKLLKEYFNNHMMEIEDLGNYSFFDYIKYKKNKFNHYKKIINIIFKLQNIKLKNYIRFKKYKIKINSYNLTALHKESDLFFYWYLKNNLKKKKEFGKFKGKIRKELNSLYKKLSFQNRCLVHRDFHVSNIMIKKNSIGIIDSQDIMKGNLLYDVASLIDDVRIILPANLKSKLFNYYLSKTKKIKLNEKYLAKDDFDILSVQRNLKILGIFVRLSKRDGKSHYLKFLPYTWNLLELRLKNPIFNNLKKLLDKVVPKKNRKEVKF